MMSRGHDSFAELTRSMQISLIRALCWAVVDRVLNRRHAMQLCLCHAFNQDWPYYLCACDVAFVTAARLLILRLSDVFTNHG